MILAKNNLPVFLEGKLRLEGNNLPVFSEGKLRLAGKKYACVQ